MAGAQHGGHQCLLVRPRIAHEAEYPGQIASELAARDAPVEVVGAESGLPCLSPAGDAMLEFCELAEGSVRGHGHA